MSYTPTTQETGDTITAEKLNNMEQGIANASSSSILVVTDTEGVLDKTWQELFNASFAVIDTVSDSDSAFIIHVIDAIVSVAYVEANAQGEQYRITTADGNIYYAASANDYPMTN